MAQAGLSGGIVLKQPKAPACLNVQYHMSHDFLKQKQPSIIGGIAILAAKCPILYSLN